MYDAYSATQIIDQLHDYVMDDIELRDKQKAAILEQIAVSQVFYNLFSDILYTRQINKETSACEFLAANL